MHQQDRLAAPTGRHRAGTPTVPGPGTGPGGNGYAGDSGDVAYDENVLSEVIRPAAIVPEDAARAILVELSLNSVHSGGVWRAEPSRWNRYDRPWVSTDDPGDSCLLGSIQVAYGTPTKYEITIYRASITRRGAELGLSVQGLTDEALGHGDLSLDQCPRASIQPPPKPFRF
ncbi:MAG: hypothetical protein ACXV3S_08055 [Kineosporiaceae bacterium]